MKEILNQLKTLRAKLDKQLDERDIYFKERPTNWRESEDGNEFKYKTGVLEDVRYNVNNAIESLIYFIDGD